MMSDIHKVLIICRSFRSKSAIILCVFYTCILFASCSNMNNTTKKEPAPWPGSLAVGFTSSVTYESALRIVTNLGLQPAMDCGIGSHMLTPGVDSIPQPRWHPVGQRDNFAHEHRLLVDLAFAPDDWLSRLKATTGVSNTGFLDPKNGVCQTVVYGTPSPGVAVPLTAVQAGSYAHITFKQPVTNYDEALYTVSNVGLRLADPCYEQSVSQSKSPWRSMNQEKSFTDTHTLIVATSTLVTSDLWQTQLQSTSGVAIIQTPFMARC